MDSMSVSVKQLSESNKRSLLSAALARIADRHDEATNILHRMRELNEEIGAQFQVKDGDASKFALRMLVSNNASIFHSATLSVTSYLAISYCWHNASWKTAASAQPMTEWGISLPMLNRILTLRRSGNEGIWIDTACIQQSDEVEKRIAVSSMDLVYRSCRRLIIVMEDIQLTEEEQVAVAKYEQAYDLQRNFLREKVPYEARTNALLQYCRVDESDLAAVGSFVLKAFKSRWFSRAWCAHEARLHTYNRNNAPLVLCFGHDGRVLSFHYRFLHYMVHYLGQLYAIKPDQDMSLTDMAATVKQQWESPWQRSLTVSTYLISGDDSEISFLYYFHSMLEFGCQELNDLCTIGLNLSGIPLIFTGNVRSSDQIRFISTLITIAKGDMTPLIIDQIKSMSVDDKGRKYRSWADHYIDAYACPSILTPYPQTITHVDEEFIELDLLLVMDVPMTASDKSIQAAKSILDHHRILSQLHSPNHKDYHVETLDLLSTFYTNNGFIAQWSQEALAYAIECGLGWMQRLPDVLDKEITSESWKLDKSITADSEIVNAATDLLRHFGVMEETTNDFQSAYVQPLVRFFLYFTYSPIRTNSAACRCIKTRSSADFALTRRYPNLSWLAIPKAVAHLPASEERAWIVEPYDPAAPKEELKDIIKQDFQLPAIQQKLFPFFNMWEEGIDQRSLPNSKASWRVLRKQQIIGCAPVEADGQSVILLKKQKVYGGQDYDFDLLGKVMQEILERRKQTDPPLDGSFSGS